MLTITSYGAPYRYAQAASAALMNNQSRIASGQKMWSDDPSGMSIAISLESRAKSMSQGSRNIQDGISLIQIADASLNSIAEDLQRGRALIIKGANGTLNDNDRNNIVNELNVTVNEIVETIKRTKFNGISLLSNDTDISIQTGADADDMFSIKLSDISLGDEEIHYDENGAAALNIEADDFKNPEVSAYILNLFDRYAEDISSYRVSLGASQNALSYRLKAVEQQSDIIQNSADRIQEVDYAKEISAMSKNSIKLQASMSMISQANRINSEMVARILGIL